MKIVLVFALFFFYAGVYLLSYGTAFREQLWVGILLFLFLPPLFNILCFDKEKYSLSFFISGIFVLALAYSIGADSNLFKMGLDGLVGTFYFALGIIFVLAALVTGLREFITSKKIA